MGRRSWHVPIIFGCKQISTRRQRALFHRERSRSLVLTLLPWLNASVQTIFQRKEVVHILLATTVGKRSTLSSDGVVVEPSVLSLAWTHFNRLRALIFESTTNDIVVGFALDFDDVLTDGVGHTGRLALVDRFVVVRIAIATAVSKLFAFFLISIVVITSAGRLTWPIDLRQ